jgi:hypothetical protein
MRVVYEGLCLRKAGGEHESEPLRRERIPPVDLRAVCLVLAIVRSVREEEKVRLAGGGGLEEG